MHRDGLRRIRLVLEYDGSAYCGWQRQRNGLSVQEVMEKAASDLEGRPVRILAAGRTDAGVHALGQVACFDTHLSLSAATLLAALNARLPRDVVVLRADEVPLDFHPRFHAVSKHYRYRVLDRRVPSPLRRDRVLWVKYPLEVDPMREAARLLVGEHDFRAFCTESHRKEDTVRRLFRLDVTREGDEVRFDLEADGFLYNMVRRICGLLLEVGRGACGPETVSRHLEAPFPPAGPTLPPCGLYLVEVKYPSLEENL